MEGSGLDVEPSATFRNVFWTKNSLWVIPISGSEFSLQLMETEQLINSQAYFHKAKSRALLAEAARYNQALQAAVTAWEMNSLLFLALVQSLSMGRDTQKSKADDRARVVQPCWSH